jgi:hypothetical protein
VSETFAILWVLSGIPGALIMVAKSSSSQRTFDKVMLGILAIFMLGPIATLMAFFYRKEPPSK